MAVLGRGFGLAGAQRLSGIRLDPYTAFSFFIEIEGLLVGGFSECTGLQVETEVTEYAEGGLNEYTHHFRGRTKYPPLVLKHGMTLLDDLWVWHQEVVEGKVTRRNGTIYLLQSVSLPDQMSFMRVPVEQIRSAQVSINVKEVNPKARNLSLGMPTIPATWWNFKNAYPVKWTGPEFRADSNSIAFESVELVHEGLSRWEGILKKTKSLSKSLFKKGLTSI